MSRSKFFRQLSTSVAVGVLLFGISITFKVNTPHTSALSASDFQAGRIIDDIVFFNGNTMSPGEIQSFLNAKVPTCDTYGTQIYSGSTTRAQYSATKGYYPPFTCLKDYHVDTPARSAETGLCNGYAAASNQSAAEIIYNVGVSCGVSQKALIVLLQKEQGLVTDDWPWPTQYRSATGYGCPDTAACDSTYYGFFNQVWSAARQFKNYARVPSSFNYIANRNNYIQYNPDANCGGTTVFIQNQATAGLYNYTPYQPNPGALSGMSDTSAGSTVACGAYGNRNFFWYYNRWFGSTFRNLITTPGNGVYKIENGTKRAFPDEAIFLSYGNRWSDVLTVSNAEFNGIPYGPAMPYNVHYRDGQLVTTDGKNIYLIADGQKRNIPSESVFLSYSWKWSYVRTISAQEFNYIPAGAAMPYNVHYRDGQLVRATGSTGVYLVQNGTKRAFPSAEIFLSYGHQWSLITNISSEELGLMPVGQDLPYNVHYRDGQLITKDGNSIYLINNGQKRNIPSESVFLSYSWKWSYVRTISAQEFNYIPAGDPVPYNTNG